MKFIDFGDLVEVTYNNGNQELVSKEEALALGYKEREKLCGITYNNKVYNVCQFSKLTGINTNTVYAYYRRGITDGEELIRLYQEYKANNLDRPITYKGEMYVPTTLSRVINITNRIIIKYYDEGLHTGEEIIEAYNRDRNQRLVITYNGQKYTYAEFGRLAKMTPTTVANYHKKGYNTGEEIIEACNKNRLRMQTKSVSYNGQVYASGVFSKLVGIPKYFVRDCCDKGITAGEEIITLYKESGRKYLTIPYKGKQYTSTEFSKLFGVKVNSLHYYAGKGLHTGEEILQALAEQQQSKKKVSYNGHMYTRTEFADISRIPYPTIISYYTKYNIRTGEEMIARYNKNKEKTYEVY